MRDATTTEDALRNTLAELDLKADVVTVASHDEGLAKLEAGEIAAYFGDQAILIFLATRSQAPDQLKLSNRQFTFEPYALALTRGDSEFRLLVDRTLARTYRSGTIDQLYQRLWSESRPHTGVARAVRDQRPGGVTGRKGKTRDRAVRGEGVARALLAGTAERHPTYDEEVARRAPADST